MELTIQTKPMIPTDRLPPLARAREAAQQVLEEAGREFAEVSIVLTDDAEIHALNKLWRGYDKPTDVLSWPQEDGPLIDEDDPEAPDLLGDVVISLDTAARQAAARGWDLSEEVALLLVHGILHLLGHEDETEAGSEGMKRIEARILGKPLDKVETA